MKRILKAVLIILSAVMLIFFLMPLVYPGILNAGNLMGIIFSAAMLLCGLFINNVAEFFRKLCAKKYGKLITGCVVFVLIAAIAFVVYAGILISTRFHKPPTEPTTAVVLGCKVNPNGPSNMLKSRIDAACTFLKENPEIMCIVSGGMGDDEHISEARCMYEELTRMGIDKDRIFMEDRSSNTRENILYSKEIIERENLPAKITIITNEFHQYRASNIASKLGTESFNVSGGTPPGMFPTYFLREIGGVLFELVF